MVHIVFFRKHNIDAEKIVAHMLLNSGINLDRYWFGNIKKNTVSAPTALILLTLSKIRNVPSESAAMSCLGSSEAVHDTAVHIKSLSVFCEL